MQQGLRQTYPLPESPGQSTYFFVLLGFESGEFDDLGDTMLDAGCRMPDAGCQMLDP